MDNNHRKILFKMPELDMCRMSRKNSSPNPVAKRLLEVFKGILPKNYSCPFVGRMQLKDFTLNDKIFFLFPNGVIRFTVTGRNQFDNFAMFLSVLLEINN
ncbi:hypothetical protein ACKWTF_015244 [Chironomus riparius]